VEVVADRGDVDRLRAHAGDDFSTAWKLADVLLDRDGLDELRARADAHDLGSTYPLAALLADRGELDELRARACAGDGSAQSALAELLADRRDLDELRSIVRRHPDDFRAASSLTGLLLQQGELAEAQRILLATVLIGDRIAARQLPEVFVRLGRHEEARQLARYGLNTDGSLATPTDVKPATMP
jgi:thioredoxin-like negative regulator of GroEL